MKNNGFTSFTLTYFIILVIVAGLLTSCDNEKTSVLDTSSTFDLISSDISNIDFINTVENQKDFNILTFRNYYNGGGVAIGDINNDGLNDIYFTANMGKNTLYLNKGDFVFEDITSTSGTGGTRYWSTGVTMADVNGDGLLDIYVSNSGDISGENKENELFINNGDLTFSENARELGLNDDGYSVHAGFFDYDLDGDLDCFVLNNSYSAPNRIAKTATGGRYKYGAPGGDRLFRNEGGKFEDVTEESKIFSGDIDFGLGMSIGDVNNDMYPDIYVSNDFWERDYLYVNKKDGTFEEVLTDNMNYVSANSMGSDIADINNDGNMDLFSTDMLPASNYRMKAALMIEEYYLEDLKWKNSYFYQYVQNCLHVNNGDGSFKETGFFSNVAATDWSWGSLIFDMNNDGLKDIFVSNGIYHDITDLDFVDFIGDENEIKKIVEKTGRSDFRDFAEYLPHNKQKNFAFVNQGGLKFENQSQQFNLNQEGYSNGSAYGDLDNDGDYDLVVNNVNMEAFVYKNNTSNGINSNYLKVKLEGSQNNKLGIGTRVEVHSNNEIKVMSAFTARGFQSSVDPDLIFGLGSSTSIDSVVVFWPDFKKQTIDGDQVTINTTLVVNHTESKLYRLNNIVYESKYSNITDDVFESTPEHKENKYIDFDHERLAPHAMSTEGPKIVNGDVNGDGQDDFILLGASGEPDQLFVYSKGKYLLKEQYFFDFDKDVEGVCGALFDADEDGDLDYLVGTGGNEYEKGYDSFVSRFYLNDGKGNFTRELNKGPFFTGQVSCIKPYDFDRDGDMDLFVGGYAVPGNYGLTPRSYLLKNNGANFYEDITTETTGPLGMVKDAIWTDVNGDYWADLIVVGEWMPITILIQENETLIKGTTLPNSNGWWNTIEAIDADNDGDQDFVLGNWGQNMKFSASPQKPLNMYVSDFDKNGKHEGIIEWFFGEDQKSYPFASKMDLTAQLPILKKNSLKYSEYAVKQVKDLIPSDVLSSSVHKYVDNFNSSILIRDSLNLTLKPIENIEAQLSPVFAIEVTDIDQDFIDDIILGGNFYLLKPEVGRHDGIDGGYLKGLGNGQYKFVSKLASGLNLQGEVRDIKHINGNLVVARNNNNVLVYKNKHKSK